MSRSSSRTVSRSLYDAGGLAPPKHLNNIQIWWQCRLWEMFNVTFIFIKPFCHKSTV